MCSQHDEQSAAEVAPGAHRPAGRTLAAAGGERHWSGGGALNRASYTRDRYSRRPEAALWNSFDRDGEPRPGTPAKRARLEPVRIRDRLQTGPGRHLPPRHPVLAHPGA